MPLPWHRGHALAAPAHQRRADPAQAERDFIARQPMGRLASVDDIAPMVARFSDNARLITGQALLVDGGVTI